jgi:two-component system sensor histidine kinase TctE
MLRNAPLRRQLLLWLLPPLVVLWAASGIATYLVAFRSATIAYDRALFDSTLALAEQIRMVRGELRVDLPRVAQAMFESDKYDRIYYAVIGPDGEFVLGQRDLPPPSGAIEPREPVYYDGEYRGQRVRVAALRVAVPEPRDVPDRYALVLVAETLVKRQLMAREVLFTMALPQLVLIAVVCLIVWFAIGRGLAPLDALRAALERRSHRDLTRLPEENAPQEVRSLVQTLNELLARLADALTAQQRFVADAAHQLRTPIAGLKTQVELALRSGDPAEMRARLEQIEAATGRSIHLVNQLLALARAEPGGDQRVSLQEIELEQIARSVAESWVGAALGRGIDLGFEKAGVAVRVIGDPFLAGEMIGNLIDNALRYTQRGGIVTVGVRAPGLVYVEDNGPGVPRDERERVFERFHRILGTGTDGAGLGLAIVREAAHAQGAEVALGEGSGGRGTRIEIRFRPAGGTAAAASPPTIRLPRAA